MTAKFLLQVQQIAQIDSYGWIIYLENFSRTLATTKIRTLIGLAGLPNKIPLHRAPHARNKKQMKIPLTCSEKYPQPYQNFQMEMKYCTFQGPPNSRS